MEHVKRPVERVKKPEWLKMRLGNNNVFTKTKTIVEQHNLHTICSSGRCPNMGECWERGTATFMIGGEICTRSCKFCNTKTGRPLALDAGEPMRVAKSIQLMGLKHAVVTSVDRDDLRDQGANHWVDTVNAIHELNPNTTLEILIPDFQGKTDLIDLVCDTKPDVISHNIETVRRLTPLVRSAAKYDRSLEVLQRVAANGIRAKSGLMLGLGETREEILELMDELLAHDCYIMTIGQYLQPSRNHLPVVEYIKPEVFAEYKQIGKEKGFKYIESGPLVRSSYRAENCIS